MAGPSPDRQRVAVLSVNLVGLDRLADLDYEATVRRLNDDLDALARIIAGQRGILTVVSADGADIVAALPRPLDAVRASFEVLDFLAEENAALPAAQRLGCRIGIDYGEVAIAAEDLSGEPVTVAGGLTSMARPGTILASHVVFRRVKPRLHFAYRALGERPVDGASRVVRAYEIKKIRTRTAAERLGLARHPRATVVTALFLIMVAAAGTGWYAYHNLAAAPPGRVTASLPPAQAGMEPAPATPDSQRLQETRVAAAAPALRLDEIDAALDETPARATANASPREEVDLGDIAALAEPAAGADLADGEPEEAIHTAFLIDDLKQKPVGVAIGSGPSVAVLPFVDPENEGSISYFSEGVAETLVRQLGHFPHLSVLASASTFEYSAQEQDLARIGVDLGATHLLRGSAGRAGNEMVVRSELIEAKSGQPVWPQPFETRSANPSAAQQQLAAKILATFEGRDAEQMSVDFSGSSRVGTFSLAAYDYALQWRDLFEASKRASNLRARQAAIRAIELDPGYAAAYAYVAWTFMADYWWRWSPDPTESLRQALRWAEQAVDLDPNSFDGQWALGDVHQAFGEFDKAVQAYEAALAINPNAAELMQDLGTWLLPLQGRAKEGLELAERSMRLHPHHPEDYYGNVSLNYYLLGGYTHVVENVNRMQRPRLDHLLYLAASYARMDRDLEAKLVMSQIVADNPSLTADDFLASLAFKSESDRRALRDGLIRAGLPA